MLQTAEHLPGILNTTADLESRQMETSAEWMRHKEVFQRIQHILGSCQVDLFATRLNHQLPEFISWKPDQLAQGTDALQMDWKLIKGYTFPLFPDREVLAEDPQGRVHHHNGGTVVVFPGLVSSFDGEPSGTSPGTPKSQRSAKESTQSLPPTGGARAPPINHLESIREHHTAAGVSKEASDLLLAGWSKETNSTYQSGWARWCLWCNEQEVDPVSCGIQIFLDFLADLYGQGLQYCTINAIRSAVSTTPSKTLQLASIPLSLD